MPAQVQTPATNLGADTDNTNSSKINKNLYKNYYSPLPLSSVPHGTILDNVMAICSQIYNPPIKFMFNYQTIQQ